MYIIYTINSYIKILCYIRIIYSYCKMFNNYQYEYPERERLIVIGDIHGDLKRFKNILIDAQIINNNLEWIAQPPNTIVVQLGDQIDSANRTNTVNNWEVLEDTDMLYFTNTLDNIAISKGGRVISLIGNHELMNTQGNFSYVSEKSNKINRINDYIPNGKLSNILSKRPAVLKIGKLFFCHAGLKKCHLDLLKSYNKEIIYINTLWKKYMLGELNDTDDIMLFEKLYIDNDGILWNRELDSKEDNIYTLNEIKCIYMFIGHNTVERISLLNDSTWFVDTGISRAYGNKTYQYIDINNFNINIKEIKE